MDDEQQRVALQQRTQTICLLTLTAIALGLALAFLRPVLVPFVLALFISMAVTPVMDFLHLRLRFPRALAIVATIAIGFLALILLGALVSSSLGELALQKDLYLGRISELKQNLSGWLEGLVADHPRLAPLKLEASLDPILDKIPAMVGAAIGWTVESGFLVLSRGFLVLIFMMFLITGHRGPKPREPKTLAHELRAGVMEYLRVKVLASALTGSLVYVILRVIGIDLALVFGLASFFLNFIPNIGSVVAVLLPVPIILLAGSDTVEGGVVVKEGVTMTGRVLAFGLPVVVQFLVGNVLEPKWMGTSLDLNPIVILLSLIFWGMLWGPIGMLLSVPITWILKALLERFSYTEPLARLLADKAPVRPEDLKRA
jgi:AI-2 transport protein TqsA